MVGAQVWLEKRATDRQTNEQTLLNSLYTFRHRGHINKDWH